MPKWLPKSCKSCKVKAGPGVIISRRGLCRPCAAERMTLAIGLARAAAGAPPIERAKLAKVTERWVTPMGVGGSPVAKRNAGTAPASTPKPRRKSS